MNYKYGVLYNNAALSGVELSKPDKYVIEPSPDFVLCRDSEGTPTAIYGGDTWDLNPLRLSGKLINVITFSIRVDNRDSKLINTLIQQIKHILFSIIYYNGSGKLGRLSAITIVAYFHVLRKLSEFIVIKNELNLVSELTLFDFLSNEIYLNSFLNREDSTVNEHKTISAIINCLSEITEDRLLFISCTKKDLNIVRRDDNQHPVIPSRIYLNLISLIDVEMDKIYKKRESITKLIKNMSDRHYGKAKSTQFHDLGRKKLRVGEESYRPTMEEALTEFGLLEVYENESDLICRSSFIMWLRKIQYISKLSIHLYTGMRDQELSRMMYECLEDERISESVVSNGTVIDEGRIIPLVSTTTKFSGYKKSTRWLAPEIVRKSVEVAQSIAEGIAYLHGASLGEVPLFVKTSIIRSEKSKLLPETYTNTTEFKKYISKDFIINADDFNELTTIDQNRNFVSDERFNVGELWPITSHQFRRSLAFYALNSGFVSLDTLGEQFKHLSRMMARYYGKGAEKLLPIFTQMEEKVRKTNHIAYDFKISSPIAIVEQLYKDLFSSSDSFLGSTGSKVEKLKAQVDEGSISISESKEQTLKLASDGKISWRETPIGGCVGTGTCKSYLMGELTNCLTQSCTVIDINKVNYQINKLKQSLNNYDENSHEYEIALHDLERLESYMATRIRVKVQS